MVGMTPLSELDQLNGTEKDYNHEQWYSSPKRVIEPKVLIDIKIVEKFFYDFKDFDA